MSSLTDDVAAAQAAKDAARDAERAERLQHDTRRRNERLTRENAELRDEIGSLHRRLDLISSIEAAVPEPPKWLRAPSKGGHRGIVSLVLSDTHFDEVVRPEQIDFLNAYNRGIAEQRTRAAFEKTIVLARDYVKGIDYDGAALFLTGDLLSGNIHDELKQTNEGTLFEAVEHWLDPLIAGITMLADDFGKLVVPCVVGNHGRMTRKPVAKNRAQDNVEWLVYKALERHFRGDERVTFMVSDAADVTVPLYATTFLATHGDQFRGGSGISGAMAPLLLGQHRKTRRQMAAGKPFDWLVMGHWHQYMSGKGLIVSGSMKGYDEYAFVSNFVPEPPQLAWWITTPENGVTISAPVLPADREAEGW